MEGHRDAVAAIAAEVQDFYKRKEPFRIYHGSTNTTRPSQYRRSQMIDTSHLRHVLEVNTQDKTILVEPNVPMDVLVEATLPQGLILPVVIDFPGITAGGGFAGTAGESSSFRYGMFDRTITWIEIVLANGDIATASRDKNADLFYGAAASFGTLGITTLMKIELVEAKTYVELSYHRIANMPEALKKIEQFAKDPMTDYLDGILFAPDHGVICAGRLKNNPARHIQKFTRARDPWFYLHAKRQVEGSGDLVTESVPLVDYLFRYDRGAFWMGFYAFRYFMTPFNSITRWILDRFMHTRVMYHALHKSEHSKQLIIQDVAVPYSAAEDFLSYLDKSFGHYPLWLCPLRFRGRSPQSPYGLLAEKVVSPEAPEMMLNFGIWGPGPKDHNSFIEANQNLEKKIKEIEGRKWLYAHVYYAEHDFWSMYSRSGYDALRAKYHAEHLSSIYDKVRTDNYTEQRTMRESWITWLFAMFWSIWPLSGLYGVYNAAVGGDYLLPRESWGRKRRKKKEL
ncbi:hypothetical protein MMC28_000270 [Mycoblastus sanguinarius]|nr:hypothetical protein [Mycoblastus sanguinarius]